MYEFDILVKLIVGVKMRFGPKKSNEICQNYNRCKLYNMYVICVSSRAETKTFLLNFAKISKTVAFAQNLSKIFDIFD